MNERINELMEQADIWLSQCRVPETGHEYMGADVSREDLVRFAQLIVRDYSKKTIQGLMSDPAFVQAMDEYYEQKWAHRFD